VTRHRANGPDDLVGHPLRRGYADAGQDAVPRAGVDQLGQQFPGGGRPGVTGSPGRRLLGGEEDLHGAGDLGRVASDGGAVVVEDGALAAEVRGGEGGARPDVGVLGDDPKAVPFAARPDHDRRMRALDRLRLADRAAEPIAAPVEVERLLLAPEPLDQRAGLGEVGQRLIDRHHVDAVRVVLPVHELRVSRIAYGAAARADPEDQPPGRDDVDRGRHLGEHGRRANPVTGDDHAQPQPAGLRGERRQQRPRLEGGTGHVAAQRHEVIPEPGVLELGHAVRLAPYPQDLRIAEARLAGLDPEAQRGAVRCHGRSYYRQ
jgi:hypothetical protein